LICDIAFFILTSGAEINMKKHNVQTCNKNKLQQKYFHILRMFFAILDISLDLLFHFLLKKPVFLFKWHFFTSHWWNCKSN
jgi:hypothetical protein